VEAATRLLSVSATWPYFKHTVAALAVLVEASFNFGIFLDLEC